MPLNTNFGQIKRPLWLRRDRRNPLYQAVFASLSLNGRMATAYLHCIKDDVFIDPCCGSGGLLIKSHPRFKEKYGSDRSVEHLEFYGQEILFSTFAIAKINSLYAAWKRFIFLLSDKKH